MHRVGRILATPLLGAAAVASTSATAGWPWSRAPVKELHAVELAHWPLRHHEHHDHHKATARKGSHGLLQHKVANTEKHRRKAPADSNSGMSPAILCVMCLTIQYFVVYGGLRICQSMSQLSEDHHHGLLEQAFEDAKDSIAFAPMLAVLMLGVRMRAQEITTSGAPPKWAQLCMVIAVGCTLLQTVCDLLARIFNRVLGFCLSFVQLISLPFLYGCVVMLIIAAFAMGAKEGNPNCPDCPAYTPPVAPALQCTINLTTIYFLFYLILKIVKLRNRWKQVGFSRFEKILDETQETLKFCPLLAIMFIGARMRALQLGATAAGPGMSNAPIYPQQWAQSCMFLCSWCLILQVVLRFCMGVAYARGTKAGQKEYEEDGAAPDMSVFAMKFAEYALMIGMYTTAIMVMYSVSVIEIPSEYGKPTPAVSPAMEASMILITTYLVVFLILQLIRTYSEFMANGVKNNIQLILESGDPALALIPMMCILFVGARLRALEKDKINGSPQKWAQMMMYLSAVSVICMMLACMLITVFSGQLQDPNEEEQEQKEPQLGEDDLPLEKKEHHHFLSKATSKKFTFCLSGWMYFTMVVTYFAITMIIVSIIVR